MGIEKFDPMSQPKRLKSAAKLEALPDNRKLVLEAGKHKPRNMVQNEADDLVQGI